MRKSLLFLPLIAFSGLAINPPRLAIAESIIPTPGFEEKVKQYLDLKQREAVLIGDLQLIAASTEAKAKMQNNELAKLGIIRQSPLAAMKAAADQPAKTMIRWAGIDPPGWKRTRRGDGLIAAYPADEERFTETTYTGSEPPVQAPENYPLWITDQPIQAATQPTPPAGEVGSPAGFYSCPNGQCQQQSAPERRRFFFRR